MTTTSISSIGNAHNEWLSALQFYRQDLHIMNDRLIEIAGKYTSADVGKMIEHYQNQFIIQQDNIAQLLHDIQSTVSEMSAQAEQTGTGHVDGSFGSRLKDLAERFSIEEKIINFLRADSNQFSAIWM